MRVWLSGSLLSLLVLALPKSGVCAEPSAWTLEKVWDISLGPPEEGHPFYRGAVCPDGTYYFSDALGRVVEVSSDGKILSDGQLPEVNALAVTCDAQSHLIAAPPSRIVTVGPDGNGALSVLHTISLNYLHSSTAIASAGRDSFFVLGLEGDSALIRLINNQGELLSSYQVGNTPPWSPDKAVNGTLAWDSSTQQLLHIAENPYFFMKYDRSHGLVTSTPRNDPEFQEPVPGVRGDPMNAPGDRVMRASYLPGGDLVVQVMKRSVVFNDRVKEKVLRTGSYIELFDRMLNLKATAISVKGFGYLQGAAQDGALYFNLIRPGGEIQIIKARLTTN